MRDRGRDEEGKENKMGIGGIKVGRGSINRVLEESREGRGRFTHSAGSPGVKISLPHKHSCTASLYPFSLPMPNFLYEILSPSASVRHYEIFSIFADSILGRLEVWGFGGPSGGL